MKVVARPAECSRDRPLGYRASTDVIAHGRVRLNSAVVFSAKSEKWLVGRGRCVRFLEGVGSAQRRSNMVVVLFSSVCRGSSAKRCAVYLSCAIALAALPVAPVSGERPEVVDARSFVGAGESGGPSLLQRNR